MNETPAATDLLFVGLGNSNLIAFRMPKRKDKKKKSKGDHSESSTPSSTPSVDDDTQPLLQAAACGLSESRKPRCSEGTKSDSRRYGSEKRSSYRLLNATSSGNQSDLSPDRKPHSASEQGSGPSTPSRKGSFAWMKGKISPRKKSSNLECNCEDDNHELECPQLNKLQAKGKSPKRPNEPKPTLGKTSVLSKEERLPSSSSSDPTVKECSKSIPQYSKEMHNLTVPDQEREVSPHSRSKKTFLDALKTFSPKKKSPTRSPVGCADKCNRGENKDKSPKRSPNKSEMPSSRASSASNKREHNDASNEVSGNSRHSKCPSASNHGSKECLQPGGNNRTLEYSSGSKSSKKSESNMSSRSPADYDPGEGTSRGPARDERNESRGRDYDPGEGTSRDPARVERNRSRGRAKAKRIRRRWKKHITAWYKRLGHNPEPSGEDMVPLLEIMDIDDSEEKEAKSHRARRRRRAKSFVSHYYFRSPSEPSPSRLQVFEDLRRWYRDQSRRRAAAARAALDREREYLRRLAELRAIRVPRRDMSLPPHHRRDLLTCQCGSYMHELGCSREIQARLRRKRRRCKQDVSRF